MSIDGWMGKANVVSTYNEQFSLKKKEGNSAICDLEDIMLSDKLETAGQP